MNRRDQVVGLPTSTGGECPSSAGSPSFNPQSAIRNRKSPSGFTLLEMLIAIALVVVLASLAWPMLAPRVAKRRLIESADRFRSLLYMASAEARQSGRRIEVRFIGPASSGESASAGVQAAQVLIERDPLGEPGTFDALGHDWARWSVEDSDVRLSAVAVGEPLALPAEGASGSGPSAGEFPSILFGPDGRSLVGDATVTLANDRAESCQVHLKGTTGVAGIGPVEQEE